MRWLGWLDASRVVVDTTAPVPSPLLALAAPAPAYTLAAVCSRPDYIRYNEHQTTGTLASRLAASSSGSSAPAASSHLAPRWRNADLLDQNPSASPLRRACDRSGRSAHH